MSDLRTVIDDVVREAADTVLARRRIPTATYRLQFRGDAFRFRDATAIVPYLRDLGISHVYSSPCLAARAGSPHGYDVIGHNRLNPELGTDDDFREFVDALHAAGMGLIWDIVPNHMGVTGGGNDWWQDVLENGPSSPYAEFFDIDWRPAKQELRNKVLLPILGEQFGRVLEEGSLKLEFDRGAFWLRCYDYRLPIEPKSYEGPLSLGLEEFKQSQRVEDSLRESSAELAERVPHIDAIGVQRLESILTACNHLPEYTRTDPLLIEERQREKEMIKLRLEQLVDEEPAVAEFIAENVRRYNGNSDDPATFDALDALLNRQVYRVCHWKAAADEINYRRFFDINELASLCVERHDVFEKTHESIFERLVRGDVDGLRIDHVDGLFDPREYLCRLQRGYLSRIGRELYERRVGSSDEDVPDWDEIAPQFLRRLADERLPELRRIAGWPDSRVMENPVDLPCEAVRWPLYVVVEKILEHGEQLPAEWPVAGTTGYDFLNSVGRQFVDPRGFGDLVKSYLRFTKIRADFAEVVYHCKLLILRVAMSSELQLLSARLNRLSERHRRSRDFTLNNLRAALREIIACFPVYRTYITAAPVGERDRRVVNEAVLHARRRNPAIDRGLFDFVRRTLLLESPPGLNESDEAARLVFVGRLQQVSGPVMAKGVEDTAFYRYFPLASLNEVGGSPVPTEFGVDAFHRENRLRQQLRPDSLSATTTHDTKRSEDTRARISVLSEVPREWQRAVTRWSRLNRRHHRTINDAPAPSRDDEYLFYQSLIGVWPRNPPDDAQRAELIDRVQQYMSKATHEAKLYTSWINPDEEYDAAVRDFVAAALEDHPRNRFLPDFTAFLEHIADAAVYAALSQAFLKLVSPGVPDIYQGQELWDLSLVDPDNRRPVDFAVRAELLDEMTRRWEDEAGNRVDLARELARTPDDPRLKLFVTWRTLQMRRRYRTLFQDGEYVPLRVEGAYAAHVVAFQQRPARHEPDAPFAVVIAPRCVVAWTSVHASESSLGRPESASLAWTEVHATSPGSVCTADVWNDTAALLEPFQRQQLFHAFTGAMHDCSGRLDLAELLADFPVALLIQEKSGNNQ